jgi:hypothetical protein
MMKKGVSVFLCFFLIIGSLPFMGHASGPLNDSDADYQLTGEPFVEGASMDTQSFLASLSDWILGTGFGILSGNVDPDGRTVTFLLKKQDLDALTGQDRQDIQDSMLDMLSLYLPSLEAAETFRIMYQAEGDSPPASTPEARETGDDIGTPPPDADDSGDAGDNATPSLVQTGMTKKNLVFIHHSVGENWLRQGLAYALNDRGYHVADITYGWREYGDWPVWFTDAVMDLVFQELGTMSAENSIAPADGENSIVMFKSCFPNSDVGESITDEIAVYNSLLPYFRSRPDKMFILVTPPPMIQISTPGLTRQLCNWLTDRQAGWLAGQERGNVFVFDLYNVLTHPEAYHRLENGREVHREFSGADTLYYDSDGDDHPNQQGNDKAAKEFISLLDHWYSIFAARSGDSPQWFVP